MFGALLGAVGGMFQANQQAKQAKAGQAAIRTAVGRDNESFGRMTDQLAAQSRQKIGARAMEAMKHAGSLNASLSDLGVTGNSHNLLRRQIMADMGVDQQTIMTNSANALQQAQSEFVSRIGQYQSQSNQIKSSMPSPMGGFMSNLAGSFSSNPNAMTTADAFGKIGGLFNFGTSPAAKAVVDGIAPI